MGMLSVAVCVNSGSADESVDAGGDSIATGGAEPSTGTYTESKPTATKASGSGPHDVIVETNSAPGISGGTIFRPADLGGKEKYPIFIWGEGGPGDVAYKGGTLGYENISKLDVPVLWFSKEIGHGGDLFKPGGGDFTRIILAGSTGGSRVTKQQPARACSSAQTALTAVTAPGKLSRRMFRNDWRIQDS